MKLNKYLIHHLIRVMKTGDVDNQFYIFKFLALLTHMTGFLIESFRWKNLCILPF
jgi:hypothetical protein